MKTTPKTPTLLTDLHLAGYQQRYVATIAERRGCSVERVEGLRKQELSKRMRGAR